MPFDRQHRALYFRGREECRTQELQFSAHGEDARNILSIGILSSQAVVATRESVGEQFKIPNITSACITIKLVNDSCPGLTLYIKLTVASVAKFYILPSRAQNFVTHTAIEMHSSLAKHDSLH